MLYLQFWLRILPDQLPETLDQAQTTVPYNLWKDPSFFRFVAWIISFIVLPVCISLHARYKQAANIENLDLPRMRSMSRFSINIRSLFNYRI